MKFLSADSDELKRLVANWPVRSPGFASSWKAW